MECSNVKCNNPVVSAFPKFKINIRVQNVTGSVTLTLFDHEAKKLLDKTSNDLMVINDELDEAFLFPGELDSLLGKKLAFRN
ncbi:hypothetical protein L1987_38736 [Smallanthus sonchifolius]|uniref:Uncharacterized protein n=1 Tax=Smallanthus sonchifolius TaxID=185202 RepID=A0ACB9HJH1_9ASTR|nr:hypothetical protein L1987_38736 [Smallanthus sonchifolius]